MRDANALQRRRRLMLLRKDAPSIGHADDFPVSSPHDLETAPARCFHECRGKTGHELAIEVAGQAGVRTLSLDRPYVLIGRDDHCDLQIDHPAVSPQHAYLQWIDGRLFCCSLVSSAAGWVGPKPFSLGKIRVSVADLDPVMDAGDPQTRSDQLAQEVSQVQLRFHGVEQQDNLWPIDRLLSLVGSSPQCKLRLDHPEIPAVVGSLVRTSTGCWLVSIDRGDSLRVNDQPVSLQLLDVGDRIQFGPFGAEVVVQPFNPKPAAPKKPSAPSIRELAKRHRQRLGALNKSLDAVQLHLDSAHLDAVPELKSALQQYILHAQRHHREVQDALERLAGEPLPLMAE